ncbi:MAG: chemotaxis protein CheB [Opitutaceae bacterium]
MIVIGGSLGGADSVRRILEQLPETLPVPVVVARHRYPESDDLLPQALQRATSLPVIEVTDKEEILPGRAYVAPANYHLLVDDGCFSLSTDSKVNHARPSIDVLFESAADWIGSGVIGVVLSGATSDGAAGAREIQRHGGSVLVEHPDTAVCRIMPQAAIDATRTTGIHPVDEIPQVLLSLLERRESDPLDDGPRA